MKNKIGYPLFNIEDAKYIKMIILRKANKIKRLNGRLNTFIKQNPTLERDMIHRDPRLKLIDVKDSNVIFNFEGVKDEIILNKEGVFINDKNHNTLSNAVLFIENNYENVEQSIVIHVNNALTVERFVL